MDEAEDRVSPVSVIKDGPTPDGKTYSVQPVLTQKWTVVEYVQDGKSGSVSPVGEFEDHDLADQYARYLREKNR